MYTDQSLELDQVIDELGYSKEAGGWVTRNDGGDNIMPSFRLAQAAGVYGAYCFQTSPAASPILPPRPAIFVARADDENGARQLHRKMWNVGNAPFLLVVLPNQVRVYTGFNYEENDPDVGLITVSDSNVSAIKNNLADFYATEVDEGRIWQRQAECLTVDRKVDYRLLANLKDLGNILINEQKISARLAHALIGKFIYISYLRDRHIISEEWMAEFGISLNDVFGLAASVQGIKTLTEALEDRFNGSIFPLSLEGPDAPTNDTVAFVASVFRGDEAASRQLTLDFKIYDFSFIPIELLSSIYEQFLHVEDKGVSVGAFYTPEPVADYLLCELNYTKPLKIGMKVLDPCCGSGIFLVLAYRRLLELALTDHATVSPDVARKILTDSIFGVERNPDACYVTEFSLILTLLSYVDPPELHHNADFRFPTLHNQNIFEADFFDTHSSFYNSGLRFDWVVGNPPWIDAKSASKEEALAIQAITRLNGENKNVAGFRVCDAFTWAVDDFLDIDGLVGLLIHATSLTNLTSSGYRRQFFHEHQIMRVTNFSNLAYVLFAGRAEAPAASLIYARNKNGFEKPPIIHYGPFVANQISNVSSKNKKKPTWSITINENEVQSIPSDQAETGDAIIWKLALWGTYRDKRYIDKLQKLFATTLNTVCQKRGWNLCEGVQLRQESLIRQDKGSSENVYDPELKGLSVLDTDALNNSGFRFSIPKKFLRKVSDAECYLRKRGGRGGLKAAYGPHIYLNTEIAAYSEDDFVVRNPQIYLSAPKRDAKHLKALSVLLNSSIMKYMLFFKSASWGIDRNKLGLAAVKNIPMPDMTQSQIEELAFLHQELVTNEVAQNTNLFDEVSGINVAILKVDLQAQVDTQVERILRLPEYAAMLAKEFVQIRLQLNKGKIEETVLNPPTPIDLMSYALFLRDELDSFGNRKSRHKISVTKYHDLVSCSVELVVSSNAVEPVVEEIKSRDSNSSADLWKMLSQRFSQWIYVQRGLRVFDGAKVTIYKTPRLIDWIKTKALQDADDIIAEVLAHAGN